MFTALRNSTVWIVIASLGLLPTFGNAAPVPAEKPKDIDLVVCLDTSGSMNGLIDSAKIKLWDIVNELAKVKPTPNLRVALYAYGSPSFGADSGYVHKECDLTNDLDEVYSKLTALRISGGDEYVARVSQAALKQQKWCESPNALKIIFVCGNEAVDQDKIVHLNDVAQLARKQGTIINTIYCGTATHHDAAGWRDFAIKAGGAYAHIDMNKATHDPVAGMKTPFDEKLLVLNAGLNKTYVAFGARGAEKVQQQAAQDKAAAGAAPGAALARAETKANALYKNSTWDLVDRMKEEKDFDLSKVKEEDLCEDLKKLKPEERMPYLKKKAEERGVIQKENNELSGKRAKFLDDERKKLPKAEGDKALDEALKGMIRDQATSKGFELPKDEKK
jgi:hypothetical protein